MTRQRATGRPTSDRSRPDHATSGPIEPMLAKIAEDVPPEGEFLYEPKWDGFRAVVFRDASGVRIQSRDLKPLDRYFPELNAALREGLPARCVLDGEIVIAGAAGLDFDALLQRVHPASSRVQRLARETPASFVAFDLLALEGRDLQRRSQSERRMLLEAFMADVGPPIHLTPMTESRAVALQWLDRFEGAGLDGVIAKAGRWGLPARPARHVQGEARAHGRLRAGRAAVAQVG
jgi:ATP-dependent DNA ligase